MKLVVLISCMHQKDASIARRSNIQTDAVIVNQCDRESVEYLTFINKKGEQCNITFICTKERGLSRSRNMAIKNADKADVCYICDDDEYLVDDYEDIILAAHKRMPDVSVITFSLIRTNYTYPTNEHKVGIGQILKTSSVQTTFKRKDILNHRIFFDPEMGSGSGNGGGEENKFLMDCKRSGLIIWYVPQIIAEVKSEVSQWFNGFTEDYYKNISWANRRILGTFFGAIYILYWVFFRRKAYKQELSLFRILRSCFVGFFENRSLVSGKNS